MSYNKYINARLLKDSLKMINPVVITLIGAIILTTAVTYTYYPPGSTSQPQQINYVSAPSNPGSNPVGSTGAALANALIFVFIILIGGSIFVLFIKYGLGRLMDSILALTFAAGAFTFSIVILPALLNYTIIPILNFVLPYLPTSVANSIVNYLNNVNNFENIIYLLGAIIGLIYILGLTVFKNQYLHNTLMIFFGMGMGCVFGIFFESISLIAVLTALALYDIYAVFRGPLKNMFDRLDMKAERVDINMAVGSSETFPELQNSTNSTSGMFETPLESTYPVDNNQITKVRVPRNVKNPQVSNGFTLPVYATPYITIGLGDFAFFSVLISKATYFALKGNFLNLAPVAYGSVNWILILLPFIGLIVGCYATFVLLQTYDMLPALPLPIACGLLGLFLAFLLQLL